MFLFYLIFWFLGLAEKIELTAGRSIEYVFDAEGLKLRKTLKETGKPDFVVDYMGELIYHQSDGSDGKLVSIDTDEGRATPLDSSDTAFTYQFFYNDHLGNLRVAYGVAPNGAYITQENHFGPTGELLEGIGSPQTPEGGFPYNFLFQGKEREFAWGLDFDDFHSRQYDAYSTIMWQIDGAHQFASGYVGMGNNAVNGVDPDGQVWHLVAGAAIGGLINGYIHRNKPGGFWKGFAIGAVAGAVTAATGGAAGVYAATGSFAGAFSSTAVAAATTGVIGGSIAGVAGSAFGSPILGLGNQAAFGDPYSLSQYGADIAFGGITGGAFGGYAAWRQGKPILTGGNDYYRLVKPFVNGGGGHVEIGELTGQFPDADIPGGGTHQGGRFTVSSTAAQVEGRLSLYPNVLDLRTGGRIPLPNSNGVVPDNMRVQWNSNTRGEFIKQWYDKGYPTPRGGWGEYDIHHILPREFGGTNGFWNLTPVLRKVHQEEFNEFWRLFGHR